MHTELEEISVLRDYSITKKFETQNLNYGTYTLILKVEYAGILEEFKEDFIIKK